MKARNRRLGSLNIYFEATLVRISNFESHLVRGVFLVIYFRHCLTYLSAPRTQLYASAMFLIDSPYNEGGLYFLI